MLRWALIIIAGAFALFAVYVRFAPVDAARFHAPTYPATVGDRETAGSFHATRQFTTAEADVLKEIDTVIARTPRTTLVAGSVEEGIMTYVTRSRVMGFPDYTTVWIDAPSDGGTQQVNIFARLRFGQADLGVNKARVIAWLDQLGPLIVTPE